MKLTFNFVFLIITVKLLLCKNRDNNLISFTDDEEIVTITSDSETQLSNAIEILNQKGGTIFIDTPIINLFFVDTITITGELPGGIIGIRQPNGEYPRINFLKKKLTKKCFLV